MIVRNLTLLCFICILLNGCIYSFKDDCIYGLTSTQCFGENYPGIAHWQKPYSLGHTDSEQRWKDLEDCGGIDIDKQKNRYSIRGAREKNGKMILSVVDEFDNCMKNKGYISLSHKECGRKNSTTDTGMCNE